MSVRTGRCQCHAIQYELTGDPLFVHACHCTLCQQRSGSAYGLTMIIEARQFRLTHGSLATVELTADSGNIKHSHFCADCGSPVTGTMPTTPILAGLRPGTLDDTSWFTVGAHIWVKSKQPWIRLPGDIPCFEVDYVRETVWPQSSLQRLKDLVK